MSCRHSHTRDSCLSLMHTDNQTCTFQMMKRMCVDVFDKTAPPITDKNMMWHARLWKKKNYGYEWIIHIWLQIYENKFRMCAFIHALRDALTPLRVAHLLTSSPNRLNYVGWKQNFCDHEHEQSEYYHHLQESINLNNTFTVFRCSIVRLTYHCIALGTHNK